MTPSSSTARWTVALAAVSAPYVLILALILWRTPFPISEAVAILEDATRELSPASWLIPEGSYYRPLFFLTVGGIWRAAESVDAALAGIKAVQIVSVIALAALLIAYVRPRTALEAALGAAAVAVLLGSPGMADNLELPLSYTTVGMPIALAVWLLLERGPRWWMAPAVGLLMLVAIGFKEQGLVVVPIVLVAWWMGAPGARRNVVAVVVVIAVAYLGARLVWHQSSVLFEQAIGIGFTEIEPAEAAERYGDFPYGIYTYNAVSTIANVLFAEPTRGTFRIVRAAVVGPVQPWQIVHVVSSALLTGVILWWGIRALRRQGEPAWAAEARLFVVFVAALLACGVLSFNYSRARLGGMAVPFYAAAAFFALRSVAVELALARRGRFIAGTVVILIIAVGWQWRAVGTLEWARATALRNHMEWWTQLPARRREFAERPHYLDIMESMLEQGTHPDGPWPTRYPPWTGIAVVSP